MCTLPCSLFLYKDLCSLNRYYRKAKKWYEIITKALVLWNRWEEHDRNGLAPPFMLYIHDDIVNKRWVVNWNHHYLLWLIVCTKKYYNKNNVAANGSNIPLDHRTKLTRQPLSPLSLSPWHSRPPLSYFSPSSQCITFIFNQYTFLSFIHN